MHKNILILGIGLILIGFIVFYYGAVKLLKGWQSVHRWSTVTGVVTELEAVAIDPFETKPEKRKYKVHIQYEFGVAEEEYVGHTIAFDEEQKKKSLTQLERIQSNYSEGKNIVVSYNPNNTADNVLKAGMNLWDAQYILTGLAMMILGVLVLLT